MKSLIAMLVPVTRLLALAQVSQAVKAPVVEAPVANASVDELSQ